MRALAVFPLAWLAIGCDRWATCEDLAEWSLPVWRGASDEGAGATATRASDGSLGILIADGTGPVRFADLEITGAHLARVTADGEVAAIAPITDLPGYAKGILGDDRGNFIVQYFGMSSMIVAYDTELGERWRRPVVAGLDSYLFDVAPSGEVLAITEQGQARRIEYLEREGATRWTADAAGNDMISHLRIAENGDALVFGRGSDGFFARRFAASSGLRVGDRGIGREPLVVARDGGWFELAIFPEDSVGVIGRFEADGSTRWVQDLGALRSANNPALADDGALVMQISYEDTRIPRVVRFDAATGERSQTIACSHLTVIGAGGSAYFGLGLTGSSSIGLARFALP